MIQGFATYRPISLKRPQSLCLQEEAPQTKKPLTSSPKGFKNLTAL